jgi:hypothetical protein
MVDNPPAESTQNNVTPEEPEEPANFSFIRPWTWKY